MVSVSVLIFRSKSICIGAPCLGLDFVPFDNCLIQLWYFFSAVGDGIPEGSTVLRRTQLHIIQYGPWN